jgi:outer membrane protein assembly factor BamB
MAADRWSSRVGFLLAAVGAAVGLGNIWRFAAVLGTNGGGAYLVPYLLAAFDTDGERRWQYRTDAETRSPAIAGDTVYVATSTDPERAGELLALDLVDGTVRWAVDTPSPKRGTRPVVGEDAVYLGCSGRDHGRLVSRSRADGAERWTFADDNSTVYEPAVAGDRVYAGSNDDSLYALSRAGDLQWEVEMGSTVGSVAVDSDLVYASSNERLFGVARD